MPRQRHPSGARRTRPPSGARPTRPPSVQRFSDFVFEPNDHIYNLPPLFYPYPPRHASQCLPNPVAPSPSSLAIPRQGHPRHAIPTRPPSVQRFNAFVFESDDHIYDIPPLLDPDPPRHASQCLPNPLAPSSSSLAMPHQRPSQLVLPTRPPSVQRFSGFVFESYYHIDDLPPFPDPGTPKHHPHYTTRSVTAAEPRQESAAAFRRSSSSRSLRLELELTKKPRRAKDESIKAIRHHHCIICLRQGVNEMLLRCIRCTRCVHSYCLNPPETMEPKPGSWTCKSCARAPHRSGR